MIFFILLGLVDTLVGIVMLGTHLGLFHEWRIAMMGAVYLIGKGVALRGSIMSILDILAGVYLVLIMLGLRTFLVYFFFLFMVYKLVTSLMMRGGV